MTFTVKFTALPTARVLFAREAAVAMAKGELAPLPKVKATFVSAPVPVFFRLNCLAATLSAVVPVPRVTRPLVPVPVEVLYPTWACLPSLVA